MRRNQRYDDFCAKILVLLYLPTLALSKSGYGSKPLLTLSLPICRLPFFQYKRCRPLRQHLYYSLYDKFCKMYFYSTKKVQVAGASSTLPAACASGISSGTSLFSPNTSGLSFKVMTVARTLPSCPAKV